MVLRLAVVGCGSWGINHVRAATRLTGAELVVTCDPNPRARERAAKVAPDARLVAQAEEVYADPAVDAVIIASPAKTHASLTQAALEAGKHVLVEKPFVLEPGEGEKLVALAESSGRTLMVGHLLRYHPYFRSLVERVRAVSSAASTTSTPSASTSRRCGKARTCCGPWRCTMSR